MMNKRKNYYSFAENVEKAQIMRNINVINFVVLNGKFSSLFLPKSLRMKGERDEKLKYCWRRGWQIVGIKTDKWVEIKIEDKHNDDTFKRYCRLFLFCQLSSPVGQWRACVGHMAVRRLKLSFHHAINFSPCVVSLFFLDSPITESTHFTARRGNSHFRKQKTFLMFTTITKILN